MNIIWTVLILGVMIFIHEFGHFIAAKSFGVYVEEFALGMGPAILKKQGKETLYSLRLFPIGGYCAMRGENEEVEEERSFSALKPWKRLVILVAGAAMNILLALVLFMIICFSQKYVYSTEVGAILNDDVPASVLSVGDEIIKMDNTGINIYSDIQLKMMENKGEAVDITVLRNGEKMTFTLTPYVTETGYKFGFSPAVKENTPLMALRNGFYETAFSVKSVFWTIKQMITGTIGLESVSGPVGIATVVDDVVDATMEIENKGERYYILLLNILNLMALIGANLGVMNLLPLPALDGGRVLFTFVEMVIRRKVPQKFEAAVHAAGFILLMLLAVVITWSDIMKLIK
ncbi:MAG: site-2 protease family protein [Clostridia bacterium]|nr:site-2 protease family protein [Clostridia bacterium]